MYFNIPVWFGGECCSSPFENLSFVTFDVDLDHIRPSELPRQVVNGIRWPHDTQPDSSIHAIAERYLSASVTRGSTKQGEVVRSIRFFIVSGSLKVVRSWFQGHHRTSF